MSLLDRLKKIFSEPAQKRAYIFIPAGHIENADFTDSPLESGKHYFRLWLAEMFLEKQVDWFRTWYPMAHTLVSFQFGDQTLQIPCVAGASQLEGVTDANLDKLIPLDYRLTSLMPFNGGVVEIVAALVAMKGGDAIQSVVKVLGDLSKLLVVPQLSAALGVAGPVASGVQDLLGGGSGQMRLGMHKSYVGAGGTGDNLLRPGYFAVIDGKIEDYPEAEFWIRNGRLHSGASMVSAQPFEQKSHLLFRVEVRTEKDDWTSLKNIQDAYQESLRYLSDEEQDKAELAIKRALVLARTSPDLTRADRNRIAKAMRDEYEQAKSQGMAAVPSAGRTLESLIARRGIAVESALEEEPTLEKLLGIRTLS